MSHTNLQNTSASIINPVMQDLLWQASVRALKALNEMENIEPEKAEVQKVPNKTRQRFIQPVVDNFRRNKRGWKLMPSPSKTPYLRKPTLFKEKPFKKTL